MARSKSKSTPAANQVRNTVAAKSTHKNLKGATPGAVIIPLVDGKKRVMRGGSSYRAIKRMGKSVNTVLSEAGFKRTAKLLLEYFGDMEPKVIQPERIIKIAGYPDGLRVGKRVLMKEPCLLSLTFGSLVMPILQASIENDMLKVIEHAQQARIEAMTDAELAKSQGKRVQVKASQLEGAFYREYQEKDPEVLTYFRIIAEELGKECNIPAARVV